MATAPLWSRKSLDVFLKEKNRVQDEQLEGIQLVRAAEGGGWAGHLVDAGCVTENELLQLVLVETGLPYIPLLQVTIAQDLFAQFTAEFLRTFECMPIDRIEPVLTLATPNPFQQELLRSRDSRYQEVRLFVCRVSEWRECLRRQTAKAQAKA